MVLQVIKIDFCKATLFGLRVLIVILAMGLLGCASDKTAVTQRLENTGKKKLAFPNPQEGLEANSISMRDGTRLATYIRFPQGQPLENLPTVLLRTPYEPIHELYKPSIDAFVAAGYVVIVQSNRGVFDSEGDENYIQNRGEDAYDTVSWIVQQLWSNGSVGTYGCSQLGVDQHHLVKLDHPNHKAALIEAGGYGIGDIKSFWGKGGGGAGRPYPLWWESYFISALAEHESEKPEDLIGILETLPASDIGKLSLIVNNETDSGLDPKPVDISSYYAGELAVRYINDGDLWSKPTLRVEGWRDQSVAETFELLKYTTGAGAMSAETASNQHLIMSPNVHCAWYNANENTVVGERPVGDASYPYFKTYIRWFDYWLKGEGPKKPDLPLVTYYIPGKNEWKTTDVWPDKRTKYQTLYLSVQNERSPYKGVLSTIKPVSNPAGDVRFSSFTYDPLKPYPTLGGNHNSDLQNILPPGYFDQRAIDPRSDRLEFVSQHLDEGLELVGSVEVRLWVSSDAPDTDFFVKLLDIYPDGRAFDLIADGFTMRHRDGGGYWRNTPENWKPKVMQPGKVYEISFRLPETANYFAPGHRIAIHVTSSDFPAYLRNLNTGKDNRTTAETAIANNTIYHSKEYPSAIFLPYLENEN